MDVRPLVFGVGDRVTGRGRLIVDDDGVWLDCVQAVPAVAGIEPWPRSPFSVRLLGAEPGWQRVSVTGVWLGHAIEVRTQSPERPQGTRPDWSTPPGPTPVGGWPRGEVDENPAFELGDLRATGAAVTVTIFRPSRDQAVVVVAATDVAAVESVLRPQLHSRLCVVDSRWTRNYLDQIRAVLDGHWDDWTITTIGESTDEQAQAQVHASLVRVTPELAGWADEVEDGALALRPSLMPAGRS